MSARTYGQPTFECRWCGKKREYDPDYWLIGSFCSFSCHAAHGLYVYVCILIMFGSFTILTLGVLVTYGAMLHSGYIIMPIAFSLLTLLSISGVFYGLRQRKETPRLQRIRYDPKISV